MTIAIIDYIFMGAVLIALIVGLIKGFLSRLITLGGLILGFVVAGQFSTVVSGWMVSLIETESTRNLVAYIVCIIVTFIIVFIIGKLLQKLVKSIKLFSVIDRLLGAVLSVGIVYVVFAFIVAVVTIETESTLVQYVLTSLQTLIPDTSLIYTVYGDNAVGSWLMSLIFPAV